MFGFLLFSSCKKHETSPSPHPPPTTVDTVKLRLVSNSYIPGNLNAGQQDTFLLHFSKPVHLKSLIYLNSYCDPTLGKSLTDGDSVVMFYNFLCGGLGGDYPFEYSVTDSSGNTLTDSVTFHCYYHRATTAGQIQTYFLSPDGKYAWVLTYSPNQLVCLGIADTGYRKTFDLNFTPINAGYNSYNNLLYISAVDYPQTDTIYAMDPSTGEIVKRIHLPEDTATVYTFSDDYVGGFAFGANGYGMLLLQNNANGASWRVIDSRLNDSIYVHPYFATVFISRMSVLSSATVNFDGSQIIGLESGGSGRLAVLDCNTQNLTEASFPFSGQILSAYIVASKTTNEVFMVNYQPGGMNQCLLQNYAMVGAFTGFDAYSASSADFSYRAGESYYVYYFDANTLGVVDYSTGNILKSTDVTPTLSRISSTIDGSYIVLMGTNNLTTIQASDLYP